MNFRKTAIDNKLRFINVDINDTSFNSADYFNISYLPQTLSLGKNLIRFNPNFNIFEKNSNILFELIDYNGEPIYYEISDYLPGDKSRIISIYIYENTPVGRCYGTFVGKRKGSEYYDVKYNFELSVDTDSNNTTKIIFGSSPIVDIEEKIKSKYNIKYNISQLVEVNSGTLQYNLINNVPYINSNDFNFKKEMENGEFRLLPQNVIPSHSLSSQLEYTASIKEIINENYVRVDNKLTRNEDGILYTYKSFNSTPNKLIYFESGSKSDTERQQSYAYLKFRGLEPIVGDIDKIGVFVKSLKGDFQEYDLINTIVLDKNNLFVDTGSVELNTNIGNIKDQYHIDTYYQSSSADFSLKYSNDKILNSISTIYNTQINDDISFEVKDKYNINVYKDYLYTLEFRYYQEVDYNYSSKPKLKIYIIGSGVRYTDVNGFLLDTIEIDSINDIKKFEKTFKCVNNGNIRPKFLIKSGKWNIQDINISSKLDDGYNPSQINVLTPLPEIYKNEFLNFKFEYYNSNGDKSKTITNKEYIYFTGSNFYLEGDNNLITGSFSVGNSIGNGIIIKTDNSGSSIQTKNYSLSDTGSGFSIYSGSGYNGNGFDLLSDTGDSFKFNNHTGVQITGSIKRFKNIDFYGVQVEITPSQLANISNEKIVLIQSQSNVFLLPDQFILETNNQVATTSGEMYLQSDLVQSGSGIITQQLHTNMEASYFTTQSTLLVSKNIPANFNRFYEDIYYNDIYLTASADIGPYTKNVTATVYYRQLNLTYTSSF